MFKILAMSYKNIWVKYTCVVLSLVLIEIILMASIYNAEGLFDLSQITKEYIIVSALILLGAVKIMLYRLQFKMIYEGAAQLSEEVIKKYATNNKDSFKRGGEEKLISINNKATILLQKVLSPFMQAFVASIITTAITFLLFYYYFLVTLYAMIGLLCVYVFLNKIQKNKLQNNSALLSSYEDARNATLVELYKSYEELNVYGLVAEKIDKYVISDFQFKSINAENDFYAITPRYVMEVLLLLLIIFGLSDGDFKGNIEMFALFGYGFSKILPNIQIINNAYVSITGSMRFIEDINNLIDDRPVEVNNTIYNCDLDDTVIINVSSLEIAFENEVLEFDFKIVKGVINLIDGPSGSGKSSFIKCLLNIYQSTGGVIEFRKCLNIAYVPQSVVVFNDTVMKNIILNSDLNRNSYESIKKVCQIDFLGDSDVISPGGANISGGQIQRIAIARALYRNPDLLILDESLSGLDIVKVTTIVDYLKAKSLTVLLTTHDTHLKTLADVKVVLR